MKAVKKSKLLPDRAAMREINSSQRTITDYAKATPLQPAKATPNIIQNYRARR